MGQSFKVLGFKQKCSTPIPHLYSPEFPIPIWLTTPELNPLGLPPSLISLWTTLVSAVIVSSPPLFPNFQIQSQLFIQLKRKIFSLSMDMKWKMEVFPYHH